MEVYKIKINMYEIDKLMCAKQIKSELKNLRHLLGK